MPPQTTARRPNRASSKPARKPTAIERAALRLVSEQTTIPLDQLARFLDCTRSKTAEVVQALSSNRWAHSRVFLSEDSPWVWLTKKGGLLSRTGLAHRWYPPNHAYLAHFRAINEVRLHLQRLEPEGRWVCETQIEGRRPKGAKVPDAIFEVGGERHAIEVELSSKAKKAYRWILAESSERYDAVVYFAAPAPARLLRRLCQEEDWPKLIVRDLPNYQPPPELCPVKASRAPEDWEVEILRLIAEQSTIRIDQLQRFLGRETEETEQIVERLCADGFLARTRILAEEPEWVLLTHAGNRLSGSGLAFLRPGAADVDRWRLRNELRLYLADAAPDALWTSKRCLEKERGTQAKVPEAEVRLDGRRYALNIRLTPESRMLVARTDIQNRDYDAVVFFCVTRRVRLYMERLHEQHLWSNVVIRDMPQPGSLPLTPTPAERLVDSLLAV